MSLLTVDCDVLIVFRVKLPSGDFQIKSPVPLIDLHFVVLDSNAGPELNHHILSFLHREGSLNEVRSKSSSVRSI